MSILDKHTPLKTKRVKKSNQPEWINDDNKAAIRLRDTNHQLKKWNQYKYWRNQSTALIRSAKRDLFSKSISENKDNAYLWRHIKDLNGKLSTSKIPDENEFDGNAISDSQAVIEKLNYFFSIASDKLK